MVPLSTAPGALIVCIARPADVKNTRGNPFPFERGTVCTLVGWFETPRHPEPLMMIEECRGPYFARSLFKLAVLPRCLTDALTSAPVDKEIVTCD